jgi:AcrR family transcriptional regulator
MSIPMPTRDRLIEAARSLLDEGGIAAVTMAAVARVARVSRQAVYLHFRDHGELLVALVERIDKEHDLEKYIAAVRGAATPELAIEEWARMQASRNARIAPIARQLDALRHSDSASSAAWRNRTNNRMVFARELVARLAAEGKLHAKWDREEAAILLWELISFRVWDDLAGDQALAPNRYVCLVTSAALAALREAPVTPSRRRKR